MGCQCWTNFHYSSRGCLELAGVPCSVSDANLEKKISKIFEKVGFPINGNNVKDCYWISKTSKNNNKIYWPK